MKKAYMKPQTEAREMEMESMLCGSNFSNELDKTNTITGSDQILSKENNYDLWDLDDED